MSQHRGNAWTHGSTSRVGTVVGFDADSVTVQVGETIVMAGSRSSVDITASDVGYRISAEGEDLWFEPDQPNVFAAELGEASTLADRLAEAADSETLVAQPYPSKAAGMVPRPKEPGLAAVLSFLFSGLGQIYNGEIGKGVAFILVQIVNALLMLVLIGFLTAPIVWVWSMVDAYRGAERYNEALAAS